MPKRTNSRQPVPSTAAPLDPNGPKIRRSRLDPFIAQPDDIEFITVTEVEIVNQAHSEEKNAQVATPRLEPLPEAPED